jgi:hypothetical protein
VLRRIALALCLLLAVAFAAAWATSYGRATVLDCDAGTSYFGMTANRGTLEVFLRYAPGGRWLAGSWSTFRCPVDFVTYQHKAFGTSTSGGLRISWTSVPLWLPTLAFALAAAWLEWRGRRRAGKAFEVVTAADSPAQIHGEAGTARRGGRSGSDPCDDGL